MNAKIKEDTEYKQYILENVKDYDKQNMWEFIVNNGACLSVPKHPTFIPKKGMNVKYYGKGLGYAIRGIVVEDTVFYYRTPEQEEKRFKQWVKDRDNEAKRTFKKNKSKIDKRFNKLPQLFQLRIQRFRKHNRNFRWEFESYELFCCEEAVKIANALKTEDAIIEWSKKDWKEQVKQVPISDGHSGNTFGCAVVLARLYARKSPSVISVHGALVPLVGCKKYGCYHTEI